VDTNTVGCVGGCGKRLIVRIEPSSNRRENTSSNWEKEAEQGADGNANDKNENEDVESFDEGYEDALTEKYRTLIIEGHTEGCLWRQAGCKNDIYKLPIVRSAIWQPELRERFCSLLEISDSIASVQIKKLDAIPKAEKMLSNLPQSLLVRAQKEQGNPFTAGPGVGTGAENHALADQTETKVQAFTIALCGWQGTTESSTALLSCNACFQRIGLWMYQPD